MRNLSKAAWKNISDADYIAGLKSGNAMITEAFFYGLCNYMLNDIRYSLMQGKVDNDELVNELYLFLFKDNWHKLDTFAGLNGCSLCSWTTRITWRYFLKQRERLLGRVSVDISERQVGDTTDNLDAEIAMDITATFDKMPNKRYVQVLQWLLVEGYDAEEVAAKLNTSAANIYNIKHRAIVQFVEIYNAC